jgi:microcystin-dependent protein
VSRQSFRTVDVLRLEVEDDPTGYVNLVQNPNGELGGWGWVTPVAGSAMSGGGNPPQLTYASPSPAAPSWFYTEALPVVEEKWVSASWVAPTSGGYYRARFEWLNGSKALISSTAQTNYLGASGTTVNYGPHAAPLGAAFVRLRFDHYSSTGGANPVAGAQLKLQSVTVVQSESTGQLQSQRLNMVPNPSFETNTTYWAARTSAGSTPSLTRTNASAYSGAWAARVASTAASTANFGLNSNTITVSPSQAYTFQFRARAESTLRSVGLQLDWYDSAGSFVSSSLPSGAQFVSEVAGAWVRVSGTATAPAGAAKVVVYASVKSENATIPSGEAHYFDAFMVEAGTDLGSYFDGSTADTADFDYAWVNDDLGRQVSTATYKGGMTYVAPVTYIDVLGPSHELRVEREALNAGTLTATILDAALDPSKSDSIRPGKRCRLMAKRATDATWQPLFTGRVSAARVSYHLKDPLVPDQKRARIELTAVDNIATLANLTHAAGYAEISELPAVLEGAGVPWNVNGSGNQVVDPPPVAFNDNASVIDQVAMTRDSNMGHAWVDQRGVLQVWDRALWNPGVSVVMTTGLYSELDLSFSTEDCINEVVIKFLRLNPTTGETEEVTHGPWRDEASIAEWGVRKAEYTVQGLSEETTAIEDLANAILTANATPRVRANSVLVPIRAAADIKDSLALLDLHDVAQVQDKFGNLVAPGVGASPIVGVEHSITPEKWLMRLRFTDSDSVAAPTYVPSPTPGANGLTIGQLLRPVGEMTMFYGEVAAGWLECDGTTFDANEYPRLAAYLGGTTLPNLVDRFPIGAGNKALGTSGGDPTKTIAAANLPKHTHDLAHDHSNGSLNVQYATTTGTGGSGTRVTDVANTTGGTGTSATASINVPAVAAGAKASGDGGFANTPLDVMNPWRAVRFAIRAV